MNYNDTVMFNFNKNTYFTLVLFCLFTSTFAESDLSKTEISDKSNIVDRSIVYADKYKYIPQDVYTKLLDDRKQLKVSDENIEKLARIETYLYMFEWESKNKKPISTLSKEEIELITISFYEKKIQELKSSFKAK